MSNFAALMALSASQTRQSEAAVQSALADRERREALKRKQQEEKEKKDREMEAKLRLKRFEEEKRAQERQKRMELEKAAREREMKRKEEEQRNNLLYGPKRSKSEYPSSNLGGHEGRRRNTSDDESVPGNALTREEKRKRRMEAEMRYGLNGTKRSAQFPGFKKAKRRLPGGAIDATSPVEGSASGGFRSTRERLAAEPPTLIKLNIHKRDTRTIDEIVKDIAKTKEGKVLEGEDAKEFADWFGKGKNKAKPESRASSIFGGSDDSDAMADTPASNKPVTRAPGGSKSNSSTPPVQARGTTTPKFVAPIAPSRPANGAPMRGSSISVKAIGKPAPERTPSSSFFSKSGPSAKLGTKASSTSLKAPPSARPMAPAATSRGANFAPGAMKKRPRSHSLSASPPPPRKRPVQSSRDDLSSEIWKLFGKDRNAYVSRDVLSDDEDMEAGADDLLAEEAFSSRIARREDELALEEERRHEEEKRRKRKEREKRGY
ncbi:hypothetical protein NLI96_g449 [Meripilus lineatus]|uniref:SPT2 chromatin protein n=1 Tax=Meripilus lineatus TaxID=2056292 RepID=A0AAD5YJB8_9APHY|nr:hypothetical protein NLI96_g449 [Physisporinus lineatus]